MPTRAQLLRAGLGAAAALALPVDALAAAPDGDLAYVRLLAGAELLKLDFAARARPSAGLPQRMRADDRAHYEALTVLAGDAGAAVPTADAIDFTYPRRSFATKASTLSLAVELTTLTLGAYLGALRDVQTPALRLPLGQIAANEAQQLSALRSALGRGPVGRAFASALGIAAASAQLDRYES